MIISVRPNKVPPVKPVKVKFIVLTPETIQEHQDYAFMALDESDYLTLSKWIESLLLYIEATGKDIEYLERVIDIRERLDKQVLSNHIDAKDL